MLVIVRSGPETEEGRRGVKLARDMAADLVLVQNGVYFAGRDRLEGFCGAAYALESDMALRGVGEVEKGVKAVGYDGLVGLMAEEDKVVGMF
jgi:sulfur relay protein TusB/DsrH